MLELVYPDRPAPLLKEAGIAVSSEMLPVVDENGTVFAQAPRDFCHLHKPAPLHPVVHLHIMNRDGMFYLQRRSESKKQFPLMWDTAVGGHVSYGEYVMEALYREAGEELAFFDFNPIPLESYVFESETERELVCAFAAVGNFSLNPSNDEVCEGRWWSPAEIENVFGSGKLTRNCEQEFVKFKDRILALL